MATRGPSNVLIKQRYATLAAVGQAYEQERLMAPHTLIGVTGADWTRPAKGGLKGMTKKDYNAIVDAIVAMVNPIRRTITGGGERGAHGEAATRQIVEIIAAQLGLVFARDNKDFDSFRFMEAINKRLARML